MLLYIGGHSRYEDTTETISHDFLSVCRSTLKREIKEEIGIAIALNDIIPKYIYFPTNERSEKHLAVCFVVPITILEHFFNIKWKKSDQVTIFNYEV